MNWVFLRCVSGSGISDDGKKRRKRGEGSRQKKKTKEEKKKKLACQGNEWCLWPCAFLQNHVAIYLFTVYSLKVQGTMSFFVDFYVVEVKLKPSTRKHHCSEPKMPPEHQEQIVKLLPKRERNYTCMWLLKKKKQKREFEIVGPVF